MGQYKSARNKLEIEGNVERIALKAEANEEYSPALKGWETIAKMEGYFERESDAGQFDRLIAAFQVNVTVNQESPAPDNAIDITPKNKGK